MATHPPKNPVVFRNFSLHPSLDLHLMRFCKREKVLRSKVFQQALFDFLMFHAPELASTDSIETILEERWELRGTGVVKGVPNGPSDKTLETSRAMELHKTS
jgi:hypothetical protein